MPTRTTKKADLRVDKPRGSGKSRARGTRARSTSRHARRHASSGRHERSDRRSSRRGSARRRGRGSGSSAVDPSSISRPPSTWLYSKNGRCMASECETPLRKFARHHCRTCGGEVCSACGDYEAILSESGVYERVCIDCTAERRWTHEPRQRTAFSGLASFWTGLMSSINLGTRDPVRTKLSADTRRCGQSSWYPSKAPRAILAIDVGLHEVRVGIPARSARRQSFIVPFRSPSATPMWQGLLEMAEHELHFDFPDTPAVVAEPSNAPDDFRARVQQNLAQFGVPAAVFVPTPVLALKAAGRSSGVVLDLGLYTSRVDIVVENEVVWSGATDLGGFDVSAQLSRYLHQSSSVARDLGPAGQVTEQLERLKAKVVKVAPSAGQHRQAPAYTMPDGRQLQLDLGTTKAAEVLFVRNWEKRAGRNDAAAEPSVVDVLVDAYDATARDQRDQLWREVFVIGGGSAMPGLDARLQQDLRHRKVPVRQILPRGALAAWSGAVAFATDVQKDWKARDVADLFQLIELAR